MSSIEFMYEKAKSPKELIELLLCENRARLRKNRVNESTHGDCLNKIKQLIRSKQSKLVLRGISKSDLEDKFIEKLNSDDPLYDGIFLVGEKAKNFLHEPDKTGNPIRKINSKGNSVARFIFNRYSDVRMENAPIDLTYFSNSSNRIDFIDSIKSNQKHIDYYLFGLQTLNSDNLVNFVSATISPQQAFYSGKNDLIIFSWIPDGYNHYYSKESLKDHSKKILSLGLPVLQDSFFPKEQEFSFKGAMFPHYILGVHDTQSNELLVNPALIEERTDWISDGLRIQEEDFKGFIKSMRYKRFLSLYYDSTFEESRK